MDENVSDTQEKLCILIQTSVAFVANAPIDNRWGNSRHWTDNDPLSEPNMTLTDAYMRL